MTEHLTFKGIELSEEYCKIANERIEQNGRKYRLVEE